MPRLIKSLSVAIVCALASPVMAGSPQVDQLIKQLQDKDESVRLKAAKELGKLKEKAADAIPALMEAADDPDEDVRAIAKKALAAIKDAMGGKEKKASDKVALLIKDLKSKEPKVRLAAIEKLGEMGSDAEEAGAALVEFGMMSASPKTREAAFTAFQKIDAALHKELVTLLIDQDDQKRMRAIVDLGEMGERAKPAVPALKSIFEARLKGKYPHIDYRSLKALVKIAPDDNQLQAVILGLVSTSDAAFQQIDRPSLREGKGFLIELMHQTSASNKQKYAALMKGLSSTRLSVNQAALIKALGKLGQDAKGALATLAKLKLDPNEAVRNAATEAIEAIKE